MVSKSSMHSNLHKQMIKNVWLIAMAIYCIGTGMNITAFTEVLEGFLDYYNP